MTVELPAAVAWTLAGLLVLSWGVVYLALRSRRKAKRALERVENRKRSQSTRYGQLTEQFAPWMQHWPFDPEAFRFLGDPIDGVQFTEEAVYLVEIKAAGARRSSRQSRIRELVEQGRVGWLEFRVSGEGETERLEPWR